MHAGGRVTVVPCVSTCGLRNGSEPQHIAQHDVVDLLEKPDQTGPGQPNFPSAITPGATIVTDVATQPPSRTTTQHASGRLYS